MSLWGQITAPTWTTATTGGAPEGPTPPATPASWRGTACSRDRAGAVLPTPSLSLGLICVLSEHLCASERRRTSLNGAEKTTSEVQSQQMAYSQDGAQADGGSDPGGDIELELRALDLADSEVGDRTIAEP